VQARRLRNAVNEFIPQGTKWVNQQYLVFNWNWDTANGQFMRDLFPAQNNPVATEPPDSAPRFTAKLDTLTYVYNIAYSGSGKSEGDRSRTAPSPVNTLRPCSDTALRPG
jgi:hypothetical protein